MQDSNQEPSEDDGEKTVDENSDEVSPKDEEVIKRGKGKPKIVIDKYIISCQNMF